MGRTVRLHRQDHTVEMAPVRIPEQQPPPKPAPKPQRPQSAAQPGPTGPVAASRPQSAPRPAAAVDPPAEPITQTFSLNRAEPARTAAQPRQEQPPKRAWRFRPQKAVRPAQPEPTGPVELAPRPQTNAPRPAATAVPPAQRAEQPANWPDDPAAQGNVRPPLPDLTDTPEWEDAPEPAQPENQPEQPEPAKRKGLFKYKKPNKPKPAKQKAAKPAKAETPEDRAAEAAKLRKGYLALARRVVLVAAMFWLLFGVVFMLARVQGNEMFPAVKDGDLVLAYRLQQSCTKNDVVVYQADGVTHVGRVLALAGDVVNITEDGTLMVNGTTQSGEILYPTYPASAAGLSYPYTVPEGSVFILADYRTNAADSRNFGAIRMRDVKGTVLALLRRRGL